MVTPKRRLTSVDVARASGLSRATVSYVLNNPPGRNVPLKTRERVLNAAQKIGYRPSAPARALRAGYSRLILGVLQFERVDPNLARDMHYLEAGLAARKFTLIWHVGSQMASPTHPASNLAAALVIAIVDDTDPRFATFLRQFGAPVLTMANESIREAAGREQVAHLAQHGRRRIVFAASDRPDVQFLSRARLSGVQQECARLGLKAPLVQIVPPTRSHAREALAKILTRRDPPLGICCYNDEVAFAVMAALSDANISVPDSVAVIGCDDIPLAQFTNPPLTTVSFNHRQFLDELMKNILKASGGKPVQAVPPAPPSVIVRGSA